MNHNRHLIKSCIGNSLLLRRVPDTGINLFHFNGAFEVFGVNILILSGRDPLLRYSQPGREGKLLFSEYSTTIRSHWYES
jgi:hypothetical protein